jgi:hypothetical protein
MPLPKYPLPAYLQDIYTVSSYAGMLKLKARNLRNRDRRNKKPVALKYSVAKYREKVHGAIMDGGRTDPYTGETIDWTLISKWDGVAGKDRGIPNLLAVGFDKSLYLSPSIDHVYPDSDELELEVCSWIANSCKSVLNPAEFIALCGKVAACSRRKSKRRVLLLARKYILPAYMEGILSWAKYEKMIDTRAENIYKRDLAMKRPYALGGSKAFYKECIHAAFMEQGEFDPYTGDRLDYTLIAKWPSLKNKVSNKLSAGRLDKKFYLLPVVDHTDPDAPALSFEICSWLVNECKGNLDAANFVALCEKVTAYCTNHGQ